MKVDREGSIIKNTMLALQYIVMERDIRTLYDYVVEKNYGVYFKSKYINRDLHDRDSILKEISVDDLTQKEKGLLFVYCHLYYLLYSFPIEENLYLSKLRNKLEIYDTAVAFVFTKLDIEFLGQYLKSEDKLLCILNPVEALFQWINRKARAMSYQGIYFKKYHLRNLQIDEYQHIADLKARELLEKTPGLPMFTKKFFKYGLDKMQKIQCLGSNYRIDDGRGINEYSNLEEACRILDIDKIPDLYVQQGFLNAYTVGDEETSVVLTSGCFSLLNYDELLFVLGHELGHIKSKHVLYHQMAKILLDIGRYAGAISFGINDLITAPLKYAILDWYRKSEFTADRTGLLACQNLDAAITCMMKLSGYPLKYYNYIDPNDMVHQAKAFSDYRDISKLNSTIEKLMLLDDTHPRFVIRCQELIKWVETGNYQKLINQH